MKSYKELFLRCCCSCAIIVITKFEDDDNELYFGMYQQHPYPKRFRDKLMFIYRVLFGNLKADDVILNRESVKKLKEFIKDL